jgi:hypothetical protein
MVVPLSAITAESLWFLSFSSRFDYLTVFGFVMKKWITGSFRFFWIVVEVVESGVEDDWV